MIKYAELKENILITAPESFEFVLLHLDSIARYLSTDKGEFTRTYDYCDSKDYITWERYFEDLLTRITSEHLGFSYGKRKLNPYFKNSKCGSLFIEQICKCFVGRRE